MSTVELKKLLIDKIEKTENEALLAEAFRLLGLETEDIEIHKLNEHQSEIIAEARQQIKNGQFLTNEQANKEIEEWLNK